jgi:hypothetical protein
MDPDATPCLIVFAEPDAPMDMKRLRQRMDATIKVVVAYVVRDQTATRGRQDAGYVMRCVMDSLQALHAQPAADEWKMQGNVQLLEFDTVTEGRAGTMLGQSRMVGILLLTGRARYIY